MTPQEFNQLARAAKLRPSLSLAAAHRVLVGGIPPAEAARISQIDPGGLSRYLRRFPVALCPCCGAVSNKEVELDIDVLTSLDGTDWTLAALKSSMQGQWTIWSVELGGFVAVRIQEWATRP